ncbi:unnamed protein product, partial [Symbiodinium sp. CCMP2456]
MRKDNRPYFVCKRCKDSWVFCHKAETEQVCNKCGAKWPKYNKPNPVPQGGQARDTRERSQPRRAPKQQNVAQRALRTVWEALPAPVKDTIENVGWTPPAPSAPPGLSQGNRPTAKAPRDTNRGGKGKGKGRPAASQDSEQPDEAQEALRALFATAADDQKELLLKLGFEAPQEAAPDLTELLKKHIAQLPPAVRAAVEEPPPEPLSAQEQLTDTSRKYKDATTELRLLITRKSALQLKLDKHKKAYNDMLRDMQALDASLKEKQDTVTGLQTELQSSVEAAIAPGGGPDIEAEFFKHLAQLSDDHLQDIKERLCLTIDDAAKRRKVTNATVPDADMRPREAEPPATGKASGTMGVCHTTGPAYRDYSNCTDFDRPDEAPQANQDLEPASPMAIASAGHNTGTQSTWTSISQTRGPPGQCGPTTRSKPKSLKTKRRRRRQEREHSIPQIHDLAALLRSHSVEHPAVHQAAIDLAEWVESERMPEESLESQVAWCVLEHCSGTPGPLDTHTLAAFLDGAEEAYSPEQGEPLQLAVANVTKWRPDILRWFQQTKASCFLGQETHLNSEQTQQARASLAGVGLHSFWAGATEGKQSKGGIVVATPWQSHPRLVQERTVEGCGYLAVELPRVKWRLVVITVYLKAGTGLHVEPNASLLADLMALTKTLPNWVAAGDWNVDVDKFASTNINTILGAEIIADKAAAISTGNTLDFVLASRSVAPMLTLTVDKAVPFAPHFALNLTLNLEHGMCHLPTLPAFPGPPGPYDTKVVQNYDQDIAGSAPENGVAPPGASCAAPQDQHRLLNGDTLDIGGVKLDNSGTTAAFAALSTSVERSVFNAVHGRGVARPVAYQPLLRDDRAPQRWHGKQLAFLTQTLQALKQCRPLAPLPSEVHKLALGYIEELGPEQEAPAWLATLGVIAGEASPPSADLSKVQLETAIALLTNDEAQERVLAGCPAAVALSKVALWPACSQVLNQKAVDTADTWVDDLSVDFCGNNPQQVAAKGLRVARALFQALSDEGLQVSFKKTTWIASSSAVQAALKQQSKGDPVQVSSVAKDLGIANAAGRARRTQVQSNRLTKGNARSSKLQNLKVHKTSHRVRVSKMGCLSAAIWGHQGLGLSPKQMRAFRTHSAVAARRYKLGSVDVVFSLGEGNCCDPLQTVVIQHWRTLHKLLFAHDVPQQYLRLWQVTWDKLSKSSKRWSLVKGPVAAMIAYLQDHGVDAQDPFSWKCPTNSLKGQGLWSFPADIISLQPSPSSRHRGEEGLRRLLQFWTNRRIGQQDACEGAAQGVDWTVPRRLLRTQAAKPNHLTSLRT